MHAGIPATIEECDVLHPGTPGYEREMRQRIETDRATLARLNGGIHFVPLLPTEERPELLPLPYRSFNLSLQSILSCSTYQRGGERIIRFGIATGLTTMMYIDYDEVAAGNFVQNIESTYSVTWSGAKLENIFTWFANGERQYADFGVFYQDPNFPVPKPDSDFGFEGVWDFLNTPLVEPLVISTVEGTKITVTNLGTLFHVSFGLLTTYDPESSQRILEEMEKYIWPGSIIETLH